MKHVFRLILLATVVALGYWAWTFFFPDPQKVIHDRLVKLAKLSSFSSPEGNIARVANVEKLGGYFAEEIEVIVDVPGVESHTFNRREELMQGALQARSVVSSFKVSFPDIHITINPDNQTAVANAAMQASAGGQEPLFQELKIDFKKEGSAWLITRLSTVRTLRQ